MPTDAWLDAAEATISEGVREMCCRLNQGSTSFRRASANLARTAHLDISAETLRQVVEAEGQAVLRLFQQGELSPAAWPQSPALATPQDRRGQRLQGIPHRAFLRPIAEAPLRASHPRQSRSRRSTDAADGPAGQPADPKDEAPSEGKQWLDQLMHAFRHEGYNAAWDQLTAWRRELRQGAHREAANHLWATWPSGGR
jgi:hypothetical protein